MINQKFGLLTVICKAPSDPKWRKSNWECRCECGNTTVKSGLSLRNGKHPNCGCVPVVLFRNTHRKYDSVEACLANTTRRAECAEWNGNLTKQGYARAGHYIGKYVQALPSLVHRRVFLLKNGYLPEVVLHTCDNPRCINPEHLRGGNKKDNSQDAVNKGRLNRQKRKYKVLLKGKPVSLAEYSAATNTPMATLQWRARHGKLNLVPVGEW